MIKRNKEKGSKVLPPSPKAFDRGALWLGLRDWSAEAALVYGQMNEPPGARARVVESSEISDHLMAVTGVSGVQSTPPWWHHQKVPGRNWSL